MSASPRMASKLFLMAGPSLACLAAISSGVIGRMRACNSSSNFCRVCLSTISPLSVTSRALLHQGLTTRWIGLVQAQAAQLKTLGPTQTAAGPPEEIRMQTQSKTQMPVDFDFIIGNWSVKHRRLNERLCGCTEWAEFSGKSSTRKILGGLGNVEDNVLYFPDGEIKAAAFRSFDARTETWAIWWLDGRSPHILDTPVIGKFDGPIGKFFAEDSLRGNPITVLFTWSRHTDGNPTWEQAFSADKGATWETNWTMEFTRSVA